MGDPRKIRKKYEGPRHPWQRTRIEKEKELMEKYGLLKKKEIWKMESVLRGFKHQAKKLTVRTDPQSKKEEQLLLKKLYELGLIEQDAKLDSILELDVTNILNRRLQTMMCTKGLTHTPPQARQIIVHHHVMVSNQKMTIPSYLVKRAEEDKISFSSTSPFNNPDHPERNKPAKEKPAPKQETPKQEQQEKQAVTVEAT